MPQIIIRDADYSDTFANLHCACFSKGWNESMMRQTLLMPGSLGLIAYVDDKPAGLLIYAYSLDQADIVTFGVIPEFRGKKVSDALLTTSFNKLKEAGISEIFLEVAVDNPYAIELYRRHQFKQVGKRPNYYTRGDVKTDALVMRLDL